MCQSFSDLFVLQALDYLEEMTMAPFAAFDHVSKDKSSSSKCSAVLYTTPQHICFEKRLDLANIPLLYALASRSSVHPFPDSLHI